MLPAVQLQLEYRQFSNFHVNATLMRDALRPTRRSPVERIVRCWTRHMASGYRTQAAERLPCEASTPRHEPPALQ
jgi:hypothetical protein